MNLQKKALLIVAMILFFALGVNTAVLTYIASGKYRGAILSKSSTVGEGLQRELGKVLSFGIPLASLDDVSDQLTELVSGNKGIGYAMVTDHKAKILFHDHEKNIGRQLQDTYSLKAAASNEGLMQGAGDYYDLSFPLLDANDQVAGALRVGVDKGMINAQLYVLLLWALGISGFSFLMALGLVYVFIGRVLVRPITDMENAAERMASGDLTAVIDIIGKDEVASLAAAINRISLNLKEMLSQVGNITKSVTEVTTNIFASSKDILSISEVQEKAVEENYVFTDSLKNSIGGVAQNADGLLELAENTSSAILQMTQSIALVSESSDAFDNSAQEAASSIQEMAVSINQISESLKNLSASSDDISSSVTEVDASVREVEERAGESVKLAEKVTVNASEMGLKAVHAAMEGMEEIRKSVAALSDVINLLGKRSGEIGKILNVINDVTDQTNLLSLNAAIIAAQAGENGKAFAVVADEIKGLAERTAASTREIEDLISAVQKETGSSVQMAGEGIKTVERGLGLVQDVDNALSEIVESSKISTDMAKAIRKATSEQSKGIRQITQAIVSMSEQVEQISNALQEQDKGSRLIIEATEKMKEMSHQINVATREHQNGSRQISSAMENVTQRADQIAQATNQQKQGSEEIVQSMGNVQGTTSKLRNSSNTMSEITRTLKEEADNLVSQVRKFRV